MLLHVLTYGRTSICIMSAHGLSTGNNAGRAAALWHPGCCLVIALQHQACGTGVLVLVLPLCFCRRVSPEQALVGHIVSQEVVEQLCRVLHNHVASCGPALGPTDGQ